MNKQERDFHMQNHQAMAAHCAECAKAESQCADSHAALSEHLAMTDPETSKHLADLAEAHRDKAASFVTAGENYLKCCKHLEEMETEKAEESSDLKIILGEIHKLKSGLPNGLSAIPMHDHPRGTLVTRSGQPNPNVDEVAKAKASLPAELQPVIFDNRQARD